MRWTVPYKPWRGSVLPLVPVVVEGLGVLDALVDSGAAFSVFQATVADALGSEIEHGERRMFRGAGGRILAYRHVLNVRILDQAFPLTVFFSRDYLPSVNLLGRDNFFHKFRVAFDETAQQVTLEAV